MATTAIASFVFVDFENRPNLDFTALKDERVKVVLLMGRKSKLTAGHVAQITELPFEFRVIKVRGTGKNALDFALTFHLGETVSRHPNGRFYIVSGDKRDFDPLIAHLKANHVRISRHDSIAELPLLGTPAVPAAPPEPARPPPKSPLPPAESARTLAPLPAGKPVVATSKKTSPQKKDRLQSFVEQLKTYPLQRPKKKTSLLALLNAHFGGKLSGDDQRQTLLTLIEQGILSIGDKVKVLYAL